MQFSESFFTLLVYGSVVLAGLGGICLVVLLVRDLLKRSIW